MNSYDLFQTTGLTPDELSEVLQNNPRAYMAVRGAVAEKHLDKILSAISGKSKIQDYRKASSDSDKDFYLQVGNASLSLECKNVEVIKLSRQQAILDYIKYLALEGHITSNFISDTFRQLNITGVNIDCLPKKLSPKFFEWLPQEVKESGLVKYKYSSSIVSEPKIGKIADDDFISQFDEPPISIDFQRTRNSTDKQGDNRRNRFYKVGEIDLVAACLFSRTLEWKFLYAQASRLEIHPKYPDRYYNRLKLTPSVWTSDLLSLL